MLYDSSVDFHLTRAAESIKLAQQGLKREQDKKDEHQIELQKRVELLQHEVREAKEAKWLSEKENRELLSDSQYLRHELSIEQAENERLREEVARLKQDLSVSEDRVVHLESEQEKANHIIKNMFKKFHVKPSSGPTNSQAQQHHGHSHHHMQQHPSHGSYQLHQPTIQPRSSA